MNDSHTHQIGTPEDPETYQSESDGSCIVCRQDAQSSGHCPQCYGQGSFTTEDCIFDCTKCCGTGDAMTEAQRAAKKASGYHPQSISFNDDLEV